MIGHGLGREHGGVEQAAIEQIMSSESSLAS
jgi:hypothetical protein